jgi:hypothetical protein
VRLRVRIRDGRVGSKLTRLEKEIAIKTNTELTIRVQAKGGMFLGPDSYNGAIVTVSAGSTKLAGPAFTNNGDSGTRATSPTIGASPYKIITPGNPVPYYVVAAPTTVNYVARFNLGAPQLLAVEVRVPLPAEQGNQIVSTSVLVDPRRPEPSLPGFVIEVPGLWVQPELVVLGNTVNLRTKVTMMCGCEINSDAASPWPWIPSDFKVTAQIVKPTVQPPINLSFVFNSQFAGETQVTGGGSYTAEISAKQISTGNAGKATVNFQVPVC